MVRSSPNWRGSLQSIGSLRWWSASALAMALTSACIAGGGASEHPVYAEGPEPLGPEHTAAANPAALQASRDPFKAFPTE